MDKKEIEKQIYAANFKSNNGKVLRTINILRTKYNKIDGVESALKPQGVEHWEFLDCVNYLSDEGYIHLRSIENHESIILADCSDYKKLEAKVTAKGIRLLAGAILDGVVEV